MTAETSNARGEWVLVPREPTAEMVQASDEISCRAEGAEHWAAMLAAAPPPPSAPVGVEGTWLWCKLMDWCKGQGIAPATQDKLFAIAGEAHRLNALTQQPAAGDEGSRSVTNQLLHWGGIPVRVTGTVTTSPGNWPLIDAALTEARDDR